MSPRRFKAGLTGVVLLAAATALGASGPLAVSAADDATQADAPQTTYETVFQQLDAMRVSDLSIENRAVQLINATAPGGRIQFAFRDFNSTAVADALVHAVDNGVHVRGVIDGAEQDEEQVDRLEKALGPDLVLCGSDVGFALHSCLADDPRYSSDGKGLMHNKFMLFSGLADGTTDVVFQTSMNFFYPQQSTWFNDAVIVKRDAGLYTGYERYLLDMMEQGAKRTDDYYTGHVVESTDGKTTVFPSPRSQPDLDTNDTIAEQMDLIDCSQGGEIVAANQIFDRERVVIARRLARLHDKGCDVRMVFTRGDAEVLATLASAGIPATPFYWRARSGLRQVRTHNKLWLVDARSAVTGKPVKLVYAGSSNWRADEQYSDDLLLRVADDAVYRDYRDYWDVIAQRAFSDLAFAATESEAPVAIARRSHKPNAAGWYRGAVRVRIAASDGHRPDRPPTGLKALDVKLTGARTGSLTVAPEDPRGPAVATLDIHEEGVTTITYQAIDVAGNRGPEEQLEIRIDRTPPAIHVHGRLAEACELWPPNGKLRHVGTISAHDALSGLDEPIDVQATSDGSAEGTRVEVSGDEAAIALRAVKGPLGCARTYDVTANARDLAGNDARLSATCVVPHSQGGD